MAVCASGAPPVPLDTDALRILVRETNAPVHEISACLGRTSPEASNAAWAALCSATCNTHGARLLSVLLSPNACNRRTALASALDEDACRPLVLALLAAAAGNAAAYRTVMESTRERRAHAPADSALHPSTLCIAQWLTRSCDAAGLVADIVCKASASTVQQLGAIGVHLRAATASRSWHTVDAVLSVHREVHVYESVGMAFVAAALRIPDDMVDDRPKRSRSPPPTRPKRSAAHEPALAPLSNADNARVQAWLAQNADTDDKTPLLSWGYRGRPFFVCASHMRAVLEPGVFMHDTTLSAAMWLIAQDCAPGRVYALHADFISHAFRHARDRLNVCLRRRSPIRENIATLQQLIVPVMRDAHAFVLIVDRAQRLIVALDSLPNGAWPRAEECRTAFCRAVESISDEWMEMQQYELVVNKIRGDAAASQVDDSSCVAYAVANAYHYVHGRRSATVALTAKVARTRLALMLLRASEQLGVVRVLGVDSDNGESEDDDVQLVQKT